MALAAADLDPRRLDLDAFVSVADRVPTDAVDLSVVGDAISSVGGVATDVVEMAVDVGSDAAVAGMRTAGRLGAVSVRLVRRHPRGAAGLVIAVLVVCGAIVFARSRRDGQAPASEGDVR